MVFWWFCVWGFFCLWEGGFCVCGFLFAFFNKTSPTCQNTVIQEKKKMLSSTIVSLSDTVKKPQHKGVLEQVIDLQTVIHQ